MMLSPKLAALVIDAGSVLVNRAQWVILRGIPGGDLGIINIYAPNDIVERCQLWETLIQELPTSCRWILAGDFNMVETRQDKTNPVDASSRQQNECFLSHLSVTSTWKIIKGKQEVYCSPGIISGTMANAS